MSPVTHVPPSYDDFFSAEIQFERFHVAFCDNYQNYANEVDETPITGHGPPDGVIRKSKYYLLTNWLAYLYGRIQSPRPDVMPDRREGITRAAGFVFAGIDTQAI